MAEEKKKGSDFPLSSAGMLAVVLAVLGLIWSGPSPLIDERPVSHIEADDDKDKIQDIDARLWQDPLGAIQKDLKKTPFRQRSALLKHDGNNELKLVIQDEEPDEKGDHSPEKICKALKEKPVDSVLMLSIMLSGGPHPEEEEGRRRKRYAVLSALATLNFVPRDTEHIGYFKIKNSNDPGLPEAVPFELLDKDPDSRQTIIVLWLDDSHLESGIETKINKILDLANSKCIDESKITRAVIGPNKSDHLKKFVEEHAESTNITFYSAGATVENVLLGKGPLPPNLLRTIADDGSISTALVRELELRQINSAKDHVLLISEWDTFYGRSFPKTFAKAYTGDENAECLPMIHGGMGEGQSSTNVYCVKYMKGIDGLLPSEPAGKNETAQNAQNKAETVQINNNIDYPSGNYQKDYLRRLVDRIRKLDDNIRSQSFPSPVKNNGIAAIGVVGSDIYDKLMILQALRSYFPGKIFFTTDLDAAYFAPHEQPYTHNLVIGSSYGLNLAPDLQMSIPPFRDSYQTAVFFSTKLATSTWAKGVNINSSEINIRAKLCGWLNEPRIFEIGRKGAVDLSNGIPLSNPEECKENNSSCKHIHPRPDIGADIHAIPSVTLLKLSTLIFGLLLLYRMSWRSRKLFEGIENKLREKAEKRLQGNYLAALWSELVTMVPFVITWAIIIVVLYSTVKALGKEEPFFWISGVSIWPSSLLQLSALILSVWSLYRIMCQLKRTNKELENNFLVSATDASEIKSVLAVQKWNIEADRGINVIALWLDYKKLGEHRCTRAAINTIFYILFGFSAVMISGGLPVPTRGDFSFILVVTLELLCMIFTVFLIMWVVDAARLASRLIEHISKKQQSNWPSLDDKKGGWPLGYDKHVAYWIDVQFVAKYTKSTEKFIWYPILPLLLLGAARSPIFDNWLFTSGLLVSIAILLLYLFSIAFIQQYAAKEMRGKALSKLEEELNMLRGQAIPNKPGATIAAKLKSIEQKNEIALLEKMIEEIKNNTEGAFTSFMHQPMVQALLAFLSGYGGLFVLMERFF